MVVVSAAAQAEWQEHGVVLLRQLLRPESLARCQEAFEFSKAHPSPLADEYFTDEDGGFWDDPGFELEKFKHFVKLVREGVPEVAEAVQQLFRSDNVWYHEQDCFHKYGGKGRTTPFHQDASQLPAKGSQFVTVWVAMHDIPAKYALKVCRGTHRGPLFAVQKKFDALRRVRGGFAKDEDDTTPFYPDSKLPTTPDVQADIDRGDAAKWNIANYDIHAGDVLVFHIRCLHGGAHVDAEFPERKAFGLRFFGDDAFWDATCDEAHLVGPHVPDGTHFTSVDPHPHRFPRIIGTGLAASKL